MKNKPMIVIGGMGPQASVEVHSRLVRMAKASSNNSFPEIIVLSLPVPDFISDTGNMHIALRMILREGRRVIAFDPSITMMACNTAHLLFEAINKKLPGLQMRSLIDAVVLQAAHRNMKKIGLLASPTTIKTKLYQEAFHQVGITCVLPKKGDLQRLEEIIRSTIVENLTVAHRQDLNRKAQQMLADGCDGVLLGCTELPIAFGEHNDLRILDSIQVLCETLMAEHERN